MKVLHIYKTYPPVVGGIERHLRLLAEGQVRRGLDVTVLVTSSSAEAGVRDEHGVRVIRAPAWANVASTPLSPGLVGWVRRLQPDVTHLHFPYPPGELAHQVFGRGSATIVTYHSDIIRQRWLRRVYEPFLVRFLQHANRILVTSTAYLRSSVYLQRVAGRCQIVPLGIDPEPFQAVDSRRVGEIRQGHGNPLLLFVGRLRYYKGLDVLIDALPSIDASLLVVGSGPMERQWRRQAGQSPAAARIHFAGEVPDDELPAYYAAADLVALPSCERSEAFGLVLLEAMAAGRAVVGTELGTGTSFVNQHNETGLVVPPGDAPALAAAINSLLLEPERRRQFGASGRRRVFDQFHVDAMVDRTVEIYREVLNGGGTPGPSERPS